MSANIQDGYSQDELLAIGTRKKGHDLNISATDINARIPFAISQLAIKQATGFSEDELKMISERKAPVPNMQPHEIDNARISDNLPQAVYDTLETLQKFLGIRTK